jgi:tRNA dimethylallyltransferase
MTGMTHMTDVEQLDKERLSAGRCWYVTGATASGKTDVGIELARRLGGEIISLDSMAIYRGMDVGTAKPSPAARREIPHHLIDIADPVEAFSLSRYRSMALRTIDDIRQRGKTPIFVGGTALYLKALLRGIFEGPPADWEFRRQVSEEVRRVGLPALYERLRQVDPLAAHKLHPQDERRIIRALEVYKLTGVPISHWQQEFDVATSASRCRVFALRHPRPELHRRIGNRVDQMFDRGLVEEVRQLLERWGQLSHTAMQAVGYCEVIEHLNGECDLAQTKERVLVRTRRFARHQETWFRGLKECRMIEWEPDASAAALANRLYDLGMQIPTDCPGS